MKKCLLIGATTLILISSNGCVKSHRYNEMNDDPWLMEQVQKGYLTEVEAKEIWYENNK
jgi:hypothetical protein